MILWYNLGNEKGTRDLVRGMLGACIGRFTYNSSQGISKI